MIRSSKHPRCGAIGSVLSALISFVRRPQGGSLSMTRGKRVDRVFAAILFASLVAEGSAGAVPPFQVDFQYNTKADLTVREVGVESRDQATVRDITFAADPDGGEPTKAYIVTPRGNGPFAGVLWVHWLGDPATTNRTQFLSEATTLAQRGLISVLIDTMWSAPRWYATRDIERDYENSVRQAVALRRGLDLLESQAGIDKSRLALVGHDYGAMYGMIAGGIDRRPKTYVFVAPALSLNDWAFFVKQPRSKAEYLRQNATLELTDYLQLIRGASSMFQYGSRDPFVSESAASILFAAAQVPKEKRLYPADHTVGSPEAAADRAQWLGTELGLSPKATR